MALAQWSYVAANRRFLEDDTSDIVIAFFKKEKLFDPGGIDKYYPLVTPINYGIKRVASRPRRLMDNGSFFPQQLLDLPDFFLLRVSTP
jgi:hypothetical protein